jgi:hypothetical protein
LRELLVKGRSIDEVPTLRAGALLGLAVGFRRLTSGKGAILRRLYASAAVSPSRLNGNLPPGLGDKAARIASRDHPAFPHPGPPP